MSTIADRDYVLGTGDVEIERLGLQHRVWRPTVLNCWQRAGITVGSRVLDVGSGPGSATVDLAEIVGPTGEVVAVERSRRFVEHARQVCRSRGLAHVSVQERDLMTDPWPEGGFDFAWTRWVASFVPDPQKLVASLSRAVRPGGRAIFHEYIDYSTWRLAPRNRPVEDFVAQVMASWRDDGGEPDISLSLPSWLEEAGFEIEATIPRVFCVRPCDHVWRWPAEFINVNLQRLLDLGRVSSEWVETVQRELTEAERKPGTRMVTPMVLEILARRIEV